ncbi:MAG: type II secretion system protein [Deltaproteobacteria bacterium]|nr:type II secretion system protein [Deltaproteobacteria bacterium]
MKNKRGFTLIELSVVLFVLGLILWLAAPRLAGVGEPGRSGVFRNLAAGSEEAFDVSLFEKRETRLVLDPSDGTYRFRVVDGKKEAGEPKSLGSRLAITGISVEGEARPLDIVTEIRYLPGGRVPAARIFFRDSGTEGEPTDWTLKISPFDGSVDVLAGTVVKDA